MAACNDIKEIDLELDKELNTLLEKNYEIKENIRENIKEKNLEVVRVISEKKNCNFNSILLSVHDDSLDSSNVLLTLEQLANYGIISSKLSAGKRT